jgi:hypothetical protein
MFSTKKKVLRSDSNLLRKLRAMIAIRSLIVLTTVFASCSFAAATDIPKGKPQIQGGNLRIEFDNRLRSRVEMRVYGLLSIELEQAHQSEGSFSKPAAFVRPCSFDLLKRYIQEIV